MTGLLRWMLVGVLLWNPRAVAERGPNLAGLSQGLKRPLRPADVQGVLPDSARMKFMTCLSQADLDCAVTAYIAAHEVDEAPAWLRMFLNAFSTANRVAGQCESVARAIYDGFTKIGQRAQLINIISSNDQVKNLSWQGRIMVSNNNFHQAVRIGDTIYDAFTGPRGMLAVKYFSDSAMRLEGAPIINVVAEN